MRKQAFRIVGCPCEVFASETALEHRISELVRSGDGGFTVAINAEKIVRYVEEPSMRAIIERGVLHVPDGSGAVLGLRVLSGTASAKVDLPQAVLNVCQRERIRVFLLGAEEWVNASAAQGLRQLYPEIEIGGRINGFADKQAMHDAIRQSHPRVVLVALGSPRQEQFSDEAAAKFPDVLFVGCGGRFDVLAGKTKRAPRWTVRLHIEWLYRLVQEPWRWKRQLRLFTFVRILAIAKLNLARGSATTGS